MRPRILSLLIVLTIILVVPALITSCIKTVNATELLTDDGSQAVAASQDSIPAATTDGTSISIVDGLFDWQTIAMLVLACLSTIFATAWRKAARVIHAIDDALQNDGKIDKAELGKIIKAWKG